MWDQVYNDILCGCVCNFRFGLNLNISFQIHKKVVHEQIKEHVCQQCGHKFSQKSNLNNHIRTHTREYQWIVEVCFPEGTFPTERLRLRLRRGKLLKFFKWICTN